MIKKFKQFVNENDSHIDWSGIEELCANTSDLPDAVPQNVRQWDNFIKQYERACDLINGKFEPHYNWNTQKEFEQAVNEQFYLGKGFKNSIYECFRDLTSQQEDVLFKNVDWNIVIMADRFTTWGVHIGNKDLTELPLLPKKVGGNFFCKDNMLTSLKGCPQYVGGSFVCSNNKLTSLKGAPEYVGKDFYCSDNNFSFFFSSLPDFIPSWFPGKDLHKYVEL